MTLTVNGVAELRSLAGAELGQSDWFEVTQDRINVFADATDDDAWIHIDLARAATGPFGGPIAHGYLTLSLLVPLWRQLVDIRGFRTGVNYGLNKVRFPAPVPVGSKIRLNATLAEVKDVSGGVELVVDAVVECEGSAKPACAAQVIYRYYLNP